MKHLLASLILFISGSVFAQPTNDDPCGALPVGITTSCNYIVYDNLGATNTPSIPNPSCDNNFQGEDVWLVGIVPPSGIVNVDAQAGSLTNINAAVYTANSCAGPFTEIGCDESSSANPNMPFMQLTGLTPGTYIYVRLWDNYEPPIFLNPGDPLEQGNFSVCIYDAAQGGSNSTSYDCGNTPPAGDDCANATPICTFDGYCGSTAGYTDQAWSGLETPFCGSIENNSFMTFTASASTVQLNVDVSDPINDCNSGIQFFMFSLPGNCGTGTVTDLGCESPMPVGTNAFTGTGLVPGQTYYLMVDGYAGDICDYVIQAVSGVEGSLSVGGDQTICLGSSATIIATGQDGNPVVWSGPHLNQTNGDTVVCTPPAVGTYQIIGEAPALVNNCGGVSDTMIVTVVNGSNISANVGACDANGNVDITAGGGTAYMWEPTGLVDNTSGSPVTVDGNVGGTYYLYGQNNAGCPDTVEVIVPPCVFCSNPVINITPPAVVCEPGTVDIANAVGNPGGAILSYHANAADAANDVNPLGSTVISQTGTTTYYVRAEDSADPTCVTIEQITVTINPLPSVDAGPNLTVCFDELITLIANNPDGANITWDNGVVDGVSFTQSTPGTITYTATADLNGCISTDDMTITVNPAPILSIPGGNSQTICPGDVASFSAQLNNSNGTVSYEWTDEQGTVVSTTANADFSPSVTSWYYIEASDDCYTLLDSVRVTIGTVIVQSITTVDITSCVTQTNDGEIHIVMNPAAGNYDFTINPGSVTNATGDFLNLANGVYQINIVDNVTGCELDTTAAISSNLGDPPTVSSIVVDDVTCGGAQDGCIELVIVDDVDGPFPLDITWTPQNGAPIVENGAITSGGGNHQICNLYGSTWVLNIEDQLGCNYVQNIVVNEPDPLTLSFTTSEPICHGQSNGSVYINATGGSQNYTFTITNANGDTLNTGNSNGAELLPTGWYYGSIVDDQGCTLSDSVFLDQPDLITANVIVGDPLCAGDASGWAQVVNITGTQGDVNFDWNPEPGEIAQDSVFIMTAGTYTVIMVDSAGCIWQEQFTLVDPPLLTIQTISADPSYCRGNGIYPGSGTVSGTATGGTGTISYQWADSSGLGANTNTWGNRTPGWYTLCAMDANGCLACDSVYVDSLNPVAQFTATPANGTEPVTVTITDGSTDRVTNTWSFSSNVDSVVSQSSYIIGYDSLQPPFDTTYMAGEYTICLVVANDYECYDTLCQSVEIYPQPSIEDPNVITPNGDGDNDIWFPLAEGLETFECTIMNRWGNEVFVINSVNPANGWDGTNMKTGQLVSDGVYSFVYRAQAQNGEEFTGQGFIHVIRKK